MNTEGDRIVFNRAQAAALIAIIFLALLMLALAGCSRQAKIENTDANQPPISSKPQQQVEYVKLYFADKDAMYLQPEVRQVSVQGETLAEVVIKELIAGPRQKDLIRTIPPETKLLSFQVTDGVGFVNFSKELKSKHWGGTTGEFFTLYSVVNTLADLGLADTVQFLVEGEKHETLAGHFEIFEPLGPNWNAVIPGEIHLGPLEVNEERMREVQEAADQGLETWYLDPLAVAREMGSRLGFDPRLDEFELLTLEEGRSEVLVTHDREDYVIHLVQPVKRGDGGVWSINKVNTHININK
ncbi:GerMN domain-containing protein [Desulfofalx alkaliphila]|uniref:GerMN domain-containing protein n=1 Tax=Desulfofalx alkaliphila TaxID=105483 RepID=UPI00068D063C|nr:GerMN domain-containing protein [Desulfofalx alkaliphila]